MRSRLLFGFFLGALLLALSPDAGHCGAYDQLRGIAGNPGNVPEPGDPVCVANCGEVTGSGPGDDRVPYDITRAPIFVAPVGFVGGVFMGAGWYFEEMAGHFPKTGFLKSYGNYVSVDSDDPVTRNSFNFGARLGALPWLALYVPTWPIRQGIAAIADVVTRPSPPKPVPPRVAGFGASGDAELIKKREQVEFETHYAAWEKKQQQLIRDRLKEPNKTAGSIQRALMAKVPPLPGKTFSQLQSGDVLLIEPEDGRLKNLNPITLGDNAVTAGGNKSFASHTVIYLKEVNGTKLFLDNQPGEGPRILTEKDFQNKYGQRGMDVATLGKLAEPLRPDEGEALYKAAMAMHKQNYQQASDSWWGNTNYGVVGKDEVVCSESNWALLRNAGKFLPKSFDRIKVENGIDFSPADFYNSPYFVVTPLQQHKKYGNNDQ